MFSQFNPRHLFPMLTLLLLVGCGGGSDDNTSTDAPTNHPSAPTVEAGDSQSLFAGVTVDLIAEGESPSGGTLRYQWRQISGPSIALNTADQARLTLSIPDVPHKSTLVLEVVVTDQLGATARDRIELTVLDPIETAIETGNPEYLPAERSLLETRILSEIDTSITETRNFLARAYDQRFVSYDPGRNSQFILYSGLADTFPLVVGDKGASLAAARTLDNQRVAAYGSNILRNLDDGLNAQYAAAMTNVLEWLLDRQADDLQQPATLKFVLVDNTTYSKSVSFLSSISSEWRFENCTDPGAIDACLAGDADLIITGSRELLSTATIDRVFTDLRNRSRPLLYVHTESWNTSSVADTVLAFFGFHMQSPGSAGNYWLQDAASWGDYADMLDAGAPAGQIHDLISHLSNNSFTFPLNTCTGQGASCSEPGFISQFQGPATLLKDSIKVLEQDRIDIFQTDGYRLEKMLVLLGDLYRRSTHFPMDVTSTDSHEFLRAYYADWVAYTLREHNPTQPDLGNFSRSQFDQVQTTTLTRSYTSKPNFRAAGVYALPGQSIRITRLDNSDLQTGVFINTLRPTSTQEFETNGYGRPKFLKSNQIDIKPGESLYLTTPFGGPVQIAFDRVGETASFRFENVGQHPYWSSPADNATFAAALAAGDFDWAELSTEWFEVHSTLDKMRTTLNNPNWPNGEILSDYIDQYVHNNLHILAGFQGPGIDAIAEIHDFATLNGLEVTYKDIVQHMNADQPSCGAGCSGNPYDAGWAFSPLGHGDLHEFGHGLEDSRFKFEGREGHATTNFYAYYSKANYFANTGQAHECKSKPFDAMQTMLETSVTQPDPWAYMNAQDLNGWAEGAGMMLQAMMAAQDTGGLVDGWNLIPRLHIIERAFSNAVTNDSDWLAERSKFGFAQIDWSFAKSIQNNDFLLIAMSFAAQADYTDYFNMWGLRVSQQALDQVAALGLPKIATRFYTLTNSNDYCESLNQPWISISN